MATTVSLAAAIAPTSDPLMLVILTVSTPLTFAPVDVENAAAPVELMMKVSLPSPASTMSPEVRVRFVALIVSSLEVSVSTSAPVVSDQVRYIE